MTQAVINKHHDGMIIRHGVVVNGHHISLDDARVEVEYMLNGEFPKPLYEISVYLTLYLVGRKGFYKNHYEYIPFSIQPRTLDETEKFLTNCVKWGWVKYKNPNKKKGYEKHYSPVGFANAHDSSELDRIFKDENKKMKKFEKERKKNAKN